jgi:hypothetical protein
MLKISNDSYKYKNMETYIYIYTQSDTNIFLKQLVGVPPFILYVVICIQTYSLVSKLSIQKDQAL